MRRPFPLFSTAFLCALSGVTLGCGSAQKSSFLPPPQAQAPAITAASQPSVKTAQQAPATATVVDPKSDPKFDSKSALVADAQPASQQPAFSDASKSAVPDPAADLLSRVENEYLAGENNYRDGHLEAAQHNFNTGISLLIHSGLDLHVDKRLEAELNKLLDAVNNNEFEIAKTDDGAPQQKAEPAPIDEANEVTPPVDQNVKTKAEAEIKSTHSDLPLMMTDRVAGYINYFSNRGRGTFERALARSGRYEDMIRRTLQQEGVPQDLIYLAQAESGFHPQAVSRAGARGIWQFMASRGKVYGLNRTAWADDRQDPEKSTRAAAKHLRDLYHEFGDWYLAMAAYNSGPGTVQNAVKRTGYADFWELYRRNVLPKETRNYVPIILAVTIMAKNPDQYGLDEVVKEKSVPYDTVKIDYPIDLRLVADCVDASAADLQDLNPSLLRLTTPKLDGNEKFELRLPAGTASQFQNLVSLIPADKRIWWRYHKVQEGETLASIAHTYHTSVASITTANSIDDSDLSPQSHLIIPVIPTKQAETVTYARAITRYKVRRGDTVESVAENFGVSPKMIRVWNRIKGSSLAGRKVLLVHLPVTPGTSRTTEIASASSHRSSRSSVLAASAKSQPAKPGSVKSEAADSVSQDRETQAASLVHHKVRPGETLYSIATSYRTTVSALKHDNRIANIASLRPGMILIIREP